MADPVMIASEGMAPVTCGDQARSPAHVEELALGRLINIYLRELGGAAPLADAVPETIVARLRGHGRPVCVELAATGTRLALALVRSSEIGHHDFAGPVFAIGPGEQPVRPASAREVADLLLTDLAAQQADPAFADRRRAALLADVQDSLSSTVAFARAVAARTPWHAHTGVACFVAAEQSLVFGHPFHPAPKSGDRLEREGTSDRPELGASFRLHYFAVDPAIVLQDRVAGLDDPVPPDACGHARERLPATARDWPLLPVHPWQARRLRERPAIARLIAHDRLLPLGELGSSVHPTSSVRTVYEPVHDVFIKLAIDARITNFVRTNPVEHLERSLAASRVLASVAMPPRLEIVPEIAYRAVAPHAFADNDGDGAADVDVASLAVLFRRGLALDGEDVPIPVAALVEPPLPGARAPIAEALWRAGQSRGRHLTAALACEWARAYCRATLVPLLALYLREGISLEAHVQNTLVVLEDGWPTRALVRDLEGTSISRRRAMARGLFAGALRAGSSVLVDEEEAWQRLLYYAIVNHTGHVLAALAAHGPAEEWQLWMAVRHTLEDAFDRGDESAAIAALLAQPELPAKANLVSRFEDRSEKPRYVEIPNPLAPPGAAP